MRAEFDLGLAWSNNAGLSFHGGAGLEATLPIDRSIAGIITLSSAHLSLQAQDGRLAAETSLTGSLAIGPVKAVVDRIGLSTVVTFPPNGGNLGVADLDFDFKPPTGIGLSIDTHGVVSGGGTLIHDPVQRLYAGTVQPSLADAFTVTAFGLIATRMPDGSPGYSLIVFITAEDFRPIPLGMGFTLQGIGGMIAVNRTFDQDVLRAGMQNDTLKNLLFPRDPVINAPTIIRSLASAFPAKRGSYLLGILARIGWFTPTLILLDLALILEFGARKRLLVLGRISALLPSPNNDLVRINLDAIGVLDFDQDTASIDAMLVDSRLAKKFVLTGAAALRAGWGSGPHDGFVLAVGGFHPPLARAPRRVPAARPRRHRAELGQQSAADLRGIFRAHRQHHPVRGERRALCRGLLVLDLGRHRLRRADHARAAALHRRLSRLGAAQVWISQSVQGVGRGFAGRSAALAGERQGDVRNFLVRLLGALRQEADRRRSAATAAGGERPGRAQPRAVDGTELEHAGARQRDAGRGAAQTCARHRTGARPARPARHQAGCGAAQYRARHRRVRRRAG